jgi:Kef-type K+ transport system membrane component KefB
LVGPHVLGGLDAATTRSFEPVVQAALCWLTLVIGAGYGYVGQRRVKLGNLALGVVVTLLAAAVVAIAVATVARFALGFGARDAALLSLGIAAVSCETTRHAVRWVALRHAAKGPLSDLVADIADADDIVPVLLVALLFALAPAGPRAVLIPAAAGALGSVGIGLALGALLAAMLRSSHGPTEVWGLLLGSTLLGVGTIARLGLSAATTTFMMGFALVSLSRHGADLREKLGQTEHAVMLPTLMLAGVHLDPRLSWHAWSIVGVALAARVAMKLLTGRLALFRGPTARTPAPPHAALGLGLLPTGALTMALGLACALRLKAETGALVLTAAAAQVLFGELVGPSSLRRALERSGEITRAPTSEPEGVSTSAGDGAGAPEPRSAG